MTKTQQTASELSKRRWRGISKAERSKLVPRNGGRPRKYPQCPRYKSHMFDRKTNRCSGCGFEKPEAKSCAK